jgi:uncharacterized repeat protein (TIGR03803 family)
LYGTAWAGGNFGSGTVFAVNLDGTGFNTLYSFTATSQGSVTNSDGAHPTAGLVLSGNTLYGTASRGGPLDNGTVFAVNTDGTGFRTLHIFSNPNDGAAPESNLILASNTLYGTTWRGGGPLDNGTVFAINTDGTGFRTVYSFSGNSDGAHPRGGLVLSGNTLYGAAAEGGNFGSGTAFAVNTDGSGFKTLHSFSVAVEPLGGLVLSGNALYGTTYGGGSWGWGTVFSISFSPKLAIAASGTNVVLSWPTNFAGFDYSGYTLQSTTNFTRPAAWVTNATPAVIVNGQFTVTNLISGAQQFYRLSQ